MAERPSPQEQYTPNWVDRRQWHRYQCSLAASGMVKIPGERDPRRGWLVNVSSGGIALLLEQPLPIGQRAVLFVKSSVEAGSVLELPVFVVHSTRQPTSAWLVGCSFEQPIEDATLEDLVGVLPDLCETIEESCQLTDELQWPENAWTLVPNAGQARPDPK